MPQLQYLIHLIGTRPGWPDNMSPAEEKIMEEHFLYLKEFVARKKVILAGPCFDLRIGIIILQTETEQEAKAIMENEPSIKQGLMKYEMHPMRVSLLINDSSG